MADQTNWAYIYVRHLLPKLVTSRGCTMRRLACLFVLSVLILPRVAKTAEMFDREAATREAVYTLRDALGAWSHGQDWSLWEMGTERSRLDFPQHEFSQRMRKSTVRPSVGGGLEDSIVYVLNQTTIVIHALLKLESRHVGERYYTVDFTLQCENTRWRVMLGTFTTMAQWIQ